MSSCALLEELASWLNERHYPDRGKPILDYVEKMRKKNRWDEEQPSNERSKSLRQLAMRLILGKEKSCQRRLDEILSLFQRAWDVDPGSPQNRVAVTLCRSLAYFGKGDLSKGIEEMEQLFQKLLKETNDFTRDFRSMQISPPTYTAIIPQMMIIETIRKSRGWQDRLSAMSTWLEKMESNAGPAKLTLPPLCLETVDKNPLLTPVKQRVMPLLPKDLVPLLEGVAARFRTRSRI